MSILMVGIVPNDLEYRIILFMKPQTFLSTEVVIVDSLQIASTDSLYRHLKTLREEFQFHMAIIVVAMNFA